jgi:hypothetical protein
MTEEQLSALLRIKRFEQPPPQYFDRLLQDVHRRQRTELLRRPLWKIAAERVQTFFSEHSMGHLSYAGALASVLIVGLIGIGLMTSGGTGSQMANTSRPPLVADANPPRDVAPANEQLLTLEKSKSQIALGSSSLPTAQPGYAPVVHQPRYVIDTRPVSYELPSSF